MTSIQEALPYYDKLPRRTNLRRETPIPLANAVGSKARISAANIAVEAAVDTGSLPQHRMVVQHIFPD
jgi:hypothetical protein